MHVFSDQFNVPLTTNILLAKRLLVDSVYEQANLEGISCTFADTNDILQNIKSPSTIKPKDISKICFLRDAWKYLFDHLETESNLFFAKEIQSIVARADVDYRNLGKIRQDAVWVSGTKHYQPPIPSSEDINKLEHKLRIDPTDNITEQAVDAGVYLMRMQPFMDGNKRVANFLINKILIQFGKGLFRIPVEYDTDFKKQLVNFYDSGDPIELKNMIFEKFIVCPNEYRISRA